jgi:hypothetical protein
MRQLIAGLLILNNYNGIPSSLEGVIIVVPESEVKPNDVAKLTSLGWTHDAYDGWKFVFGARD